jgi:hypothetical protein
VNGIAKILFGPATSNILHFYASRSLLPSVMAAHCLMELFMPMTNPTPVATIILHRKKKPSLSDGAKPAMEVGHPNLNGKGKK